MANEVTVVEQQYMDDGQNAFNAPFLAVQTLSIGGAVSSAFNSGTRKVSIMSTTACGIEFSARNGTAPNGAGAGSGVIRIPANTYLHFTVKPATKVIAVA
jgi:hypothetical protein